MLDPLSLNVVTDTDNAPYVIEGHGDSAVRLHFESEQSKAEYLEMEMHRSDVIHGLREVYDAMLDCADTNVVN